MPFQIVHNDIVKMHTDAIVNAANSQLRMGGGVCGSIFRAAGVEELTRECEQKAPCPTGSAVITKAGHMSAKYIIHAVGPIWNGGMQQEEELLASAYRIALNLAKEYKCESVSFPLISAGIYGFPKERALQIAVGVVQQFLKDHEMDIYLVVFDREVVQISEKRYQDIQHFINQYYDVSLEESRRQRLSDMEFTVHAPAPAQISDAVPKAASPKLSAQFPEKSKKKERGKISLPWTKKERKLEDLIDQMGETFSQMLIRLIDEKGYTDVEVYKRANMDRRLFSKIRKDPNYNPKKQTVLALSVGMHLSVDECMDLLEKAGYTLSNSHRQDVIIRYFLEQQEYDIFAINEALFCFDEPPLGA